MKKIDLVYIIEDDVVSTFLIQKIIDQSNIVEQSLTFANGLEAFNSLIEQENIPAVIFLDINMPVMDGWEFLEAFEGVSFSKNIPVFILSSSIDTGDIEKSKTYNQVKGFLTKPLTPEKFSKVIEKMH
jgi:CheY-like chemotaxis protein